MQLRRTIEFGEVRDQQFGFFELFGKRLEVDELGHLDLSIKTAAFILT